MASLRLSMLSVALVLLLVLHICAVASALEAAPIDGSPKPRNIIQACRGQLEDVCDVREVERVDCLLAHYKDISSTACKEWLSARSVCMTFVEKRAEEVPACSRDDYRRCIRKTPKEQLPVACRSSDYYASLFIHKPRKFVADDGEL